ncbi:MAG: hypothetical protein J6W43_10880 [Prevotella sp.]|nr:hypothetical protein [Prevotella sp.]
MKKMMMTLIAMLTMTVSAYAMSFEQARNEALFLTDKMAYELNLTDEQYEAAYEINLDYLMGVTGRADVFGTYWERRNLDLSYILLDWQWQAYIAATYFYRPLYWEAGYWHFGIYARYPHRDYFYFGRPAFYATYRGGHAWHVHGGHGYYYDRRDHFRAPRREHVGMHDRWDRGDFRNHRNSSTRVTGGPDRGSRRVDNNRGGRVDNNRGNRIDNNRGSRVENNRGNRSENRQGSFSGSRRENTRPNTTAPNRSNNSNNNTPSRTITTPSRNNNSTPSRTISTPSRSSSNSSGSFSGNRSQSSSISHSSSAPRTSTRTTTSPSRSSSSSHSSAGSSSHSSGGSRGGGGGHFGGRR